MRVFQKYFVSEVSWIRRIYCAIIKLCVIYVYDSLPKRSVISTMLAVVVRNERWPANILHVQKFELISILNDERASSNSQLFGFKYLAAEKQRFGNCHESKTCQDFNSHVS